MFDYRKLIKKSIKSHTLMTDMFGYGLVVAGFADKYLAGQITMYKTYRWLLKRYKKEIGKAEVQKCENAIKEYVWICWLQGIEKAPKIVKDCYASVKYWLDDKEIVVITEENYFQYVEIPHFIIKKWKDGMISNTHFSDLLRLELLIRHGGLWLDATTYLTGELPTYVEENSFFVYRNGWQDLEMIHVGSWLIYSKYTNNKLLIETRDLLYKYWSKMNYMKNYFLFHMFFRMVADYYSEQWGTVPMINHIDSHLLMRELGNEYDCKRCTQIKKLTSVHKLSYKLQDEYKSNATVEVLSELYKKRS